LQTRPIGAKLAPMGISTPSVVTRFWLGEPTDPPFSRAERWWKKDPAFDAEIRERFGETLEAAALGELPEWRTNADGRLALVILLDQFSRNAFRDTPRAFAQDALAREIAIEAFAAGDDLVLPPVHVSFLLMPFMHAEDLALQQRCVEGFTKLRDEADTSLRASFESSLDFARRHLRIVEWFGRFPHRNPILGRTSTGEEIEFLKQPGSSF
jgi:uncharacterized protein (DUF924 family)